jgi:hypothetical protein
MQYALSSLLSVSLHIKVDPVFNSVSLSLVDDEKGASFSSFITSSLLKISFH